MTRLELIRLIGDVLTRVDVSRGSLSSDEPNRDELDDLRRKLDRMQLKLARNEFDDNTEAFQQAAEELEIINRSLRRTINDIERLVTTIQNLRRFVAAVNNIVGVALPL